MRKEYPVINLVVVGEGGKGLTVVGARGILDLAVDEAEAELSRKRGQRRQRIFLVIIICRQIVGN